MLKEINVFMKLFIFTFKQVDKFFKVKIFIVFEIFVNLDIHETNFRIIDFENPFFDFIINSEIN